MTSVLAGVLRTTFGALLPLSLDCYCILDLGAVTAAAAGLAETVFSLGGDARFGSSDFDIRALARVASFLGFAAAGFFSAASLTSKVDFFAGLTILGFLALSFRTLAGLLGFLIGLLLGSFATFFGDISFLNS